MNLLALDTSTPLCGVAVRAGATGATAVRRHRVTANEDVLLVYVAECLAELGLRPEDLQAVICGAGPGSFTGLRIGLASAKGLCFALPAKLVMISSLRALAARHREGRPTLACLDAFGGQVYACLFGAAATGPVPPDLLAERAWPPDRLRQALLPLGPGLVLCGSGALKYPQLLLPGSQLLDQDPAPHPLDLLRLGEERLARGEHDPLAAAVPNYVSPSAAEAAAG
jgi:tRNA threonylcarbamoyladenosine biosynthesis protein TsaB